MLIQQHHHAEQSPFSKILCLIGTVFGTGIALILLVAFRDALTAYSDLVMRVLAFSAIVLILSMVAYVSVNIYLTIEYRATENEIFKQSRQQLQVKTSEPESNESKVLELYYEMKASNSLSLNQIALEVFGKKGGYYNNQIRDILGNHDIEI